MKNEKLTQSNTGVDSSLPVEVGQIIKDLPKEKQASVLALIASRSIFVLGKYARQKK